MLRSKRVASDISALASPTLVGQCEGEHPFLSPISAGGGPCKLVRAPLPGLERAPTWEKRTRPPPGEGQDGKESVTGRGLAGNPRDTKPSHKDTLKVTQATSQ